ncbi:MAG TPA: NapC/NirT family cytochrome c [Candidatus Bathyarchaeia archaeon]|nr:NapC/NirT family cytochrome c [Candidatus Bathyarchaeia archaeon]
MGSTERRWLGALITLFGRNWITLCGAALAGASGLFIAGFLILALLQLTKSPYLGIMALLILPAVFVAGLLLIPVGVYWDHWRARRHGGQDRTPGARPFPVIDLNSGHTRRIAFIVIVLTGVNLLIISTATYHGVQFMDSPTFCGRVCHTVMEPEYTAYTGSPHSRVKCVECHIGPGAPWFVKAKLSGLGQLLAVTFNTYSRPIPTPVENLRPSQDTCEHCHWPEKFTGDRIKVITKFQEDETNTPSKSVLLMHVGGGASERHGIHSWHINPRIKTTYIPADEKRQEIAWVRVEKEDGTVEEFKKPDVETPAGEVRVMDCIDCHNRPTHVFQTPDEAVDGALAKGRIDTAIPYIKKVATEALKLATGKPGEPGNIENHIRRYYTEQQPGFTDHAKIDAAVNEAVHIYKSNVFPEMKVSWGTYPNNIGHVLSPGCSRCHNDTLKNAAGDSIGEDCSICHTVLAWDEAEPEILDQLQIK